MEAAIESAEAATAERDWGRATALWHEVLDQFGDGAPRKAHLRLSRALGHDGHIIAAQSALLEGLKRFPEDLRLRRELAELTASPTDLATSKADWKRLPRLWEDGSDTDWQRVKADWKRLARLWEDVSNADWERVARLWEDLLGSSSTPTTLMVNGLAAALCQLGRFREADEVLQRALADGIDRRDLQSVFESELLRTQFVGRFAPSSGTKTQGLEKHMGSYRVAVGARRLRDASGLNAAVTAPSAIWVPYRYGWGNTVWQIVNGLEVAERLDVPRVYIPRTWYLEGDDPICLPAREVIQSNGPSPEELLVLTGRFLVLRFLNKRGRPTVLDRTAVSSETDNPYLRLAELRPFTVFRDREPLRDDDLVIYIRAGDVFRKGWVHAGYGQPPLAYYLTVLRQHEWRSVHLVYENDQNPVIKPLLAHLLAEGIEPKIMVTGLTSTIEFLLTARTLVAGNGSVIPSIAGLSSNLARLYTFEDTPGRAFPRWAPPGVAQIDVIDDRGAYRRAVMCGNWENRPDQVELMLHYPESALRVVTPPTPS
jgi:tetratricopeptide (TPR) repeat protein